MTQQQERRMEATFSAVDMAQAQQPATEGYKSRPGALIWFFRKSRDGWKRKYQDLKASAKQLKNRVADLTKSRDQWRLQAERAQEQLAVLQAENDSLRAQAATPAAEKKPTGIADG
jgi:chromosome segregation ATPase